MEFNQHQSQLLIAGGAEDKNGDCTILREFIRRAGSLQARILIMTVASEVPRKVGEEYIQLFKRLGVEKVRRVDTLYREDANNSNIVDAIEQATGVFFTGEDQARLTQILKDTAIDQALHRRYANGLVIGGTGAGASILSNTMISQGEAATHPRLEIVELLKGMSFLGGVLIDQHFSQQGRIGRLLTALAQYPHLIGLGIDENTAIVVENQTFEVIGNGACTVIDLQQIKHNNIRERLKDESLALCDVKMHILPQGYKFDLSRRMPLICDYQLS